MTMFNSVSRVLRSFASGRPDQVGSPRGLRQWIIEPLESRRLLAATVTIGATPNVAEGNLITVTFNISDPSVFYDPTTTYVVGANITGDATVDLDYVGPAWRSASVTIYQGSGVGTASVTVQTLKDNLVEGTELMNFVLFTGGSGWVPGSPSTATTQVADDPAGVSITREGDGAENPAGTAPMTYRLNRVGGKLDEALVAYVARSGGTATADLDYVTPSDPITFAANETSKTFSVAVIDDDRYEPQESLSLVVAPNGNRYNVLGGPAAAFITSDDLLEVDRLDWEGVVASDGQSNLSWDNPYEMGSGVRLFPDKNTPTGPLHNKAKGLSENNLFNFRLIVAEAIRSLVHAGCTDGRTDSAHVSGVAAGDG